MTYGQQHDNLRSNLSNLKIKSIEVKIKHNSYSKYRLKPSLSDSINVHLEKCKSSVPICKVDDNKHC